MKKPRLAGLFVLGDWHCGHRAYRGSTHASSFSPSASAGLVGSFVALSLPLRHWPTRRIIKRGHEEASRRRDFSVKAEADLVRAGILEPEQHVRDDDGPLILLAD